MTTFATSGRPDPAEAAPYYFTYIDQVDGDDIAAVLRAQSEELGSLFTGVSEEQSLRRYSPDKWSVRQVLNHINDAERMFAFRALWFARGFDTPLPSFDQNIAAGAADADQVSWAAHIEEFRSVRLSTIALFASLPSKAWMRKGAASGYEFTVRALAFVIAGHAAHHSRILREKYI